MKIGRYLVVASPMGVSIFVGLRCVAVVDTIAAAKLWIRQH